MSRRILKGTVVSDKCDKTVTVQVVNRVIHPIYKKKKKKRKKYAAHDEKNICRVGDEVKIAEHRPISKTKKWIVLSRNGETL